MSEYWLNNGTHVGPTSTCNRFTILKMESRKRTSPGLSPSLSLLCHPHLPPRWTLSRPWSPSSRWKGTSGTSMTFNGEPMPQQGDGSNGRHRCLFCPILAFPFARDSIKAPANKFFFSPAIANLKGEVYYAPINIGTNIPRWRGRFKVTGSVTCWCQRVSLTSTNDRSSDPRSVTSTKYICPGINRGMEVHTNLNSIGTDYYD